MTLHGVILPKKNNMVPVVLICTDETHSMMLNIECVFPTFRSFRRWLIQNNHYGNIGWNDCWQNEVLCLLNK